LHKCTANVLCNKFGSANTRENYKELLKFVKGGGDVRPWTYAVSLTVSGLRKNLVSFIHTSGIWITGSQPYFLTPMLIEIATETIAKKIVHDYKANQEKAINSFGVDYCGLTGNAIGKLKFHWIVKEKQGTPNDKFLYLLTVCKV
jgi:hypothetical protein